MRYVYLREDKPGFEIASAAIEAEVNFRTVAITVPLAIHAAELRRKYYMTFGFFYFCLILIKNPDKVRLT